jgi:hypothetical protein
MLTGNKFWLLINDSIDLEKKLYYSSWRLFFKLNKKLYHTTCHKWATGEEFWRTLAIRTTTKLALSPDFCFCLAIASKEGLFLCPDRFMITWPSTANETILRRFDHDIR